MEKGMRLLRLPAAVLIALIMALSLAAPPAFASAPTKEKVTYLGRGKVEVSFLEDAEYRNVKVTVRDTSGKRYKASIYGIDDDELKFRIKKCKAGKTYKFTISGVRAEFTSKFGKVKGTFRVKKAFRTKRVRAAEAKTIAVPRAGTDERKITGL